MKSDDIGTTFSDVWYRVADLRPRVSPHAHFVRQRYGPHTTYIVEEPAGGNFYRLTEAAHFFVGLLDGGRTVGEAWDACNAQLGDGAPTQRECIDLLSRLQLFGLLMGDLPLAPDMVLERKRQARQRKREQRTGKWMFFNIPLINPESFLERHRAICRAVFSKPGFVVWAIVVATGISMVLADRRELAQTFELTSLLSPRSLVLFGLLFIVLRAIHEFGHAASCKAFGGRVTEIGIILIAYVLPLPYCDATSSWRFSSTFRRVAVAFGGVYVELFVASIAAIVWATADPSASLLRALCFRTMIISGVSTFLFNLNPLLRYDGYYILSDLAGSPNLAQRSRELWRHGLVRHVFGSRALRPPVIRDKADAALLWVFGAFSGPYRVLIMAAILFIVIRRYPGLGLVLAAIVATMWVVWPTLKAIGFLFSSPALVGHRARAVGIVGAAALALVVGVGLVPAPAASYAQGVVVPRRQEPLRTAEAGFVLPPLVKPGDPVRAGQVVFRLSNPQLEADLASARAAVAAARAERDKATSGSPTEQSVAEIKVADAEAQLADIRGRVDALSVRAPVSGRLTAAGGTASDLINTEGRYVKRGMLIGYVASTDELVVRAAVSVKEEGYIFRPGVSASGMRVGVRVRGSAGEVVPGRITNRVHRGTRDLIERSLSTVAGGQITPDPKDRSGRKSLIPYFMVEITPRSPPVGWQPGLRSRVRFNLPPEPLLDQWSRLIRQYIKGRLG